MAKEKLKEKPAKNEQSKAKKLAEELLVEKKHISRLHPSHQKEAMRFAKGYKTFLDSGKTEREATTYTAQLLQKNGYTLYNGEKTLKAGDKIYTIHRNKGIIAATIGTKPLEKGLHLAIAHLDSPRLDLKPSPLYETDQTAYFKTHYYGGIRKYQWVTIPLSMHGVVVKKDGTVVNICIGEKTGDPVFTITDLLPHLAAEQNKRSLAEGIRGEELNIIIGSLPYEDQDAKEAVKLETMRLLNKQYGITEHDFARAEIEFVPAFKAADIGFDQSMIGAYGQDDRVCAYAALMAEINTKNPQHTSVCVLTDKEETGSEGNTGLASDYLSHFMQQLAEQHGAKFHKMLASSACLSADVNAAFDPTFPDVFERRNSSFINHGVALTKYTGARGKSGTSDASAEFMAQVTAMFDEAGVVWQVAELGKVDAGGGGTIAKFIAGYNIDVVDVGVPVLSMHSPFEVTSKLDLYNMYLAFEAFAK